MPPSEAKQKIPEVEEPFDFVGPVQMARRSDMDMNGHINNVTYLAWTLETVPEDVFEHGKLCQVDHRRVACMRACCYTIVVLCSSFSSTD